MLPHELADQPLFDLVAQLIVVFDFNFQDAVAVHLTDFKNPAADDMLAHQHAQRGRLQRAGLALLRQMRARTSRACGEQQKEILTLIAHGQYDFIPLRLNDAIDPPAREMGVQLRCRKAQCQSIQWHENHPPVSRHVLPL